MIKWREPEQRTLFPLTHPQKRVWYTEQINPGTGLFNIGGVLRIKGQVDPAIMEKAVRLMFERNDALRIKIINQDGEPRQYVREIAEFSLPYYDFSKESDPEDAANKWLKADTSKLFPEGELLDCALLKVADDDYIYLQKCHHCISDGWTFGLLGNTLMDLYPRLAKGEAITEPVPPSYFEYLQDEEEYKTTNRFQKNREFWLENFQNLPQAVTFSPKTVSSRTISGIRFREILDQETTAAITKYVKDSGSSVYSFFMTVLFTYMYRATGSEDIIIGTPVLNRSNARQKEMVGMFVSTMPFRVQIDENIIFSDFLKAILKEQLTYYRNQRYPMDMLVKDLDLARKGNQKLFEISLSYQNAVYNPLFDGHPTVLDWIFNGHEENSLTVHINDRMDKGELILDFDYAVDAFDEVSIARVARHLVNIARNVIKNPETPLWQVAYMDKEELDTVLYHWNKTETAYPADKCIHELIEAQVERTPDAPAVVFAGQHLTYRELNKLANQLARMLRAKGISPDARVGLLVERSLEAVAGILGVLKSGGAYLPIDPEYPEDRVSFMLEDAGITVLLSQSALKAKIPASYQGEVIELDKFIANPTGDGENLAASATPQNLCYVIYTSGSTGKPKGVMVLHQGLTNYIWWAKNYYCPDTPANFPLYSSLSFDLTVTSIFVPLVKGNTIHVMPNDKGNLISVVMKEPGLNIVKLTPAHLALVKEEDNSTSTVRKFIVGGEDLKADLARAAVRSFNDHLEIYNEYGPTETVVGCIIYKFNPTDEFSSVLIGKPISNTKIYILDKHLQPVAPGVIGEIYIGGDGVARGYLNRPELNAERFLADPFIEGGRMYKSGDLGRYLPDGNMEYLGRVDTQVKIRGYRIETGEVEAALLQVAGVRDAIVDVKTDKLGSKYLVGYYTADGELSVSELRGALLETLPEYMVPIYFIRLEIIPLTGNGKVDRRALPEPDTNAIKGADYAAPTNEMETVIAEVWAEVLGREKVGINDNFFELGGDSIKAIQVSTRLKNRGIKCQVQDIFTYHTVGQVALHVSYDVVEIQAEQGIVSGDVPLTPVLSWFFAEKLAQADYYNQSVLLKLSLAVKLPLLQGALHKLIEQHDALRLNYSPDAHQMYYENRYLHEEMQIAEYDLTTLSEAEQNRTLREQSIALKASFRIKDSLLFKAAIFDLGTRGRRLLLTAHHLVVDGVSWRIILEDLANYYLQLAEKGAVALPAKTTSFKEWAVALDEYSRSEKALAEVGYWEGILAGSKLLPVDFKAQPGEPEFGTLGDTEVIKEVLDSGKTELLLTTANEAYKTQINDLLLTALALTVKDWTGDAKTYIRLEGHGREELFNNLDISRTVGWFTSIFPVELDLTQAPDMAAAVKGIKEQLRQVPEKGIGYGILKYLTRQPFAADRNTAGIVFNYLGQFEELPTDLLGFAFEETGPEVSSSNGRLNLLEINCLVQGGKLEIALNYSKKRFKDTTIKGFIAGYIKNLQAIIEFCSSGENYGFTPSDFDTVGLSQEDLDQLFS